LLLASWFGHLDIAKILIVSGANIVHVDNFNCTPLIRACQCSNFEIVKCLLENGADPNSPNNDGTPLQIACMTGDIDILESLLEHNADISATFKGFLIFRIKLLYILQ